MPRERAAALAGCRAFAASRDVAAGMHDASPCVVARGFPRFSSRAARSDIIGVCSSAEPRCPIRSTGPTGRIPSSSSNRSTAGAPAPGSTSRTRAHPRRAAPRRSLQRARRAPGQGLPAARAARDPGALARVGLRPLAGRSPSQGPVAPRALGRLARRRAGLAGAARCRRARRARARILGVRARRDPLSRWRSRAAVAVAGRRRRGGGARVRPGAALFRRGRFSDRRTRQSHGRLDRSRYRLRELGARRGLDHRGRLSLRGAALDARHGARRGARGVPRRARRHQRRRGLRSDRAAPYRLAQRRLLRPAYLPARRGGRVAALRGARARGGRLLARLAGAGAASRLVLRGRVARRRFAAGDPRGCLPGRLAQLHHAVRAGALDLGLQLDPHAPHADRELARRRAQSHLALAAATAGGRQLELDVAAVRLERRGRDRSRAGGADAE